MKTLELSKGLAAYHKQAEEILSWMTDWDEFDRLAREHRPFRRGPLIGFDPDTYILGEFPIGSKKELHLLQILTAEGFVKIRKSKKGGVEYRRLAEIAGAA